MPLRTLLVLLPLTLALTACNESDKDDDEDGDEDGSVLPAEGAWVAGEATLVTNGCDIDGWGEDDDTGDAGEDPAIITVTGDDSFTVVGDDINLSCTRDGADFDCGTEAETTDYSSDGIDAAITQAFSFRVSLDSATAGSLTAAISLACEGGDCGLIAEEADLTMPCESVMRLDIEHAG